MMDDEIKLGELTINRLTLEVEWGEKQLELEPKWVQVLITLAEAPNKVLTREQIINNVWADYLVGEDSLNRAISKLRKALEPVHGLSIITARGIGYQLAFDAPDGAKKQRIKQLAKPIRMAALTVVIIAVIIVSFLMLQSKQVSAPAAQPDIDHVTSDLGIEFAPDISPDNKYMAYTWNGGKSGEWDIYIKQIGIEGSKRLTNSEGFDLSPAWSNSGDKIAFFQELAKGWQLNISTFLGTEQRIVTEVRNIWKNSKVMDWGAEDKTLVYSAINKGEETYTINRLNLNDLSIEKIIADPEWDFTLPRFSPDHSLLATVGQRGVRNSPQESIDQLVGRLIIIDTATGEVIFEREAAQEISSIVWKNNTELLFTIANCIDCPVYQINIREETAAPIAHGNTEQVLTVPGIVRNIAYHRNSGDLYLEKWQADVNIWSAIYTLDKLEENKLLIGSTLIDFSPKLNPDESMIAYISNRSNTTQVWAYDMQSGESRQISNKKSNHVIKSIEWSHDGENIVLSLQDQDKKIYAIIMDLQGNELRQIEWKKSIHRPVYASDDESLFAILYDEEHVPAIWELDLKTGQWKKFSAHLATSVRSIGDYLYFTRPDKSGLWRMNYNNPQMVETVTDQLNRTRIEYWTIHGDTLKMINSDEEKSFLEMIYIPTQQQISRIRINNYIPITEASATFSGNNQVYFSSIDNYDADIVKVRLGENLD
jgi:Tol biopolymer transport system component/DNA-binding winged helix-turn-helix (wHTH) protein